MIHAEIYEVLQQQKGVLFAESAIVGRMQYSGRGIIGKNNAFVSELMDTRGYLPVEWWIMSITSAENAIKKENEGLTLLIVNDKKFLLKDAIKTSGKDLLGEFVDSWPLTKILDIGGQQVQTSFGTQEVPPIPCHVHSGNIVEGRVTNRGKLEAYFFPPLDIPPYSAKVGTVISRLGLKPNVTREEFTAALGHFGKDDKMYELCNPYLIQSYTGWTILPGVVHAPGPWTTFEIQLPQDDFNLASWQLGKKLEEKELEQKKKDLLLRGLSSEKSFISNLLNWNVSTSASFKKYWFRPSRVIEKGDWGVVRQIFFDAFYGESIEVLPGKMWERAAEVRPFAGIVWSGKGMLNTNCINSEHALQKEFLIVPNTAVTISNTGTLPLIIFTVFPIKKKIANELLLRWEPALVLKVKQREELVRIVVTLKEEGNRIVFTNGCFDILHVGHARLLAEAKKFGDVLIVGLNSDASVRSLKGPSRPIIGELDRAEVLASLSAVDYVTIFPEDTPLALLELLQPHVHVKGGDYTKEKLPETPTVEKYGGEIKIIPLSEGRSTTNIIERSKK